MGYQYKNGIDNCTEIIKIKPDFASLSSKVKATSRVNTRFVDCFMLV